jgi:hypothetical protein
MLEYQKLMDPTDPAPVYCLWPYLVRPFLFLWICHNLKDRNIYAFHMIPTSSYTRGLKVFLATS